MTPDDHQPRPDDANALVALGVLAIAGLALGLYAARRAATTDAITPPPALRLDPNSAPAEALLALPGIGPARVDGILNARAQRPFDTPEDLDRRVPGIGPKTLERLVPYLRFDDKDDDGDDPPGADPP